MSRTTVTRAYQHLRDRGFVVSRRGSGHVAHLPVVSSGQDTLLAPGRDHSDALDLTCAAPLAPHGVAQAFETAVAELPAYLSGTGYYPSGLPALRVAIAQRYVERGLPTTPDQVLVTAGGLAALAVVARALLGAGDRVLVESPTYPNAISALRRSGARVIGAAVDPNGWDLASFRQTVREVTPAAAYLVPDFHNPTGALMSATERAELATELRRRRTTVVVDETLAELAVDDLVMPEPFASYLSDTVSIGSASKTFWGGLRIGWVRAPHALVGRLVSARLSLDLGAALLEQLAVTHLLSRRPVIVQARRDQLATARDTLAVSLREHLPDWSFAVPSGGQALWCQLPRPLSSALCVAAESHGVLLAPGPSFAPEGGLERFVRVPFTAAPEQLTAVGERIAAAWADAQRRRQTKRAHPPLVA